MKKNIFSFLALALIFAGCTKEASEEVVIPSSSEGVKFVVEATIGEPATRMNYTEDGNGFKATFAGNETMQVYFINSDDSVLSKSVLNIDQATISDDNRSAKFESVHVTIPDDAVKIVSFISNPRVVFDNDKATVDLSSQVSMNEANYRHVILGTADTSNIRTGADSVLVKIGYAYKTSVLRFKLTLSDGTNAEAGTEVTLSSSDNAIHNNLEIVNGELAETSGTGDIVFQTTDVDTASHVITGYATIWAADNLKNATLKVAYGEDTYNVTLNPTTETLEGGKAYTITRTLQIAPKPVTVMKNDDAGSMTFAYSGGEDVTNDWLSCTSGVVSWTANTTGAPRTATLTFTNGATCTVTQVTPADFAGTYTFTTKVFAGTGYYKARLDPSSWEVTMTALSGETALTDADGVEHTNNLSISGLYNNVTAKAVVEIDYDAQTCQFGFFFDGRDGNGQLVESTNTDANGKYATFVPSLATVTGTNWGSPWKFDATDLGDPDYAWSWWTVSEDFKTITYANNASTLSTLSQYSDASMNRIIGISVVLSSTNVFDSSTVSGYANVFQVNASGQAGTTFVRE